MPKFSSKKKVPKDINQLAAYIVAESTKEKPLTPHSHTVHKVKKS
jgi:hypothetical protein